MTIEQATKRLLIKSPFYGLFLLSLKRRFAVPGDRCKTAYVHISGLSYEMVINQEFWDSLETDDCRLNLMLHELMHICLKHLEFPDRFPDKKKANIAEDLEVSNYVEYISKGGYYIWNYPELEKRAGAKYYYDHLPEQPKNGQNSFGNKNGNNSSNEQGDSQSDSGEDPMQENSNGVGTIDDHSVWEEINNLSEAEQQLLANQLNHILKQTAEQVQKMRGNIPRELTEIISELFKQKPAIFNWKAYFRRMLGTIIDIDIKKTRKKESNRFPDASGLKHKRKSNIFLVIDTSGSVSDKEACDFFSEINHIYKAGAKITICECDSQIQRIYEYTGKWDGKFKGRGGTLMSPAIEEFNKRRRDYQTIIFFTDGFIEHNITPIMGQSMWIITSNGDTQRQFPGKTLYIPKEK